MNLLAELARFGPDASYDAPTLDEARAYCRRLAQSHYENFTVVSGLFPRHLRQHLCNVYAYCRWADDLADEAGDDSLPLLDWWEKQLEDLFAMHGTPQRAFPTAPNNPTLRHPVFIALADTIREFDIRQKTLADLLVAFRRDQTQHRYESLADLLTYCQYSANPVGRIVLALGQALDDKSVELSDQICTGLQLANFWQDVRRDFEKGRIYLPQELCRRHHWDEAKFAAGRCDDDFRHLLEPLVFQAEALLLTGQKLVERVPSDLRLPIRVFIEGGRAILAAIRRARYDVWSQRPTVGPWTKLRLLTRARFSVWWHG